MSSSRGCDAAPRPDRRRLSLQALVEDERKILRRRDFDRDAGAQHDLRRALRRDIGRIRDRERGLPSDD